MNTAENFTDEEVLELEYLLELKRRERARNDFFSFCIYMDQGFFTSEKKHLKHTANALQMVEKGIIKKLLLSLPPRAGKSYIVSLFCSWFIGRNSTRSIMRNCYGQTLANKFSYDIRFIIQTPKYLKIFPDIKLREDKANIVDWAVTNAKQTTYFCSGVGGAITGKGADGLAISDDLFKDINEALSFTIQESTWNWYLSAHKSRMEKGCPEIHITTRWSTKDIIGRIESNEKVVDFEEFNQAPENYENYWVRITVAALDNNDKSFCEEIQSTEAYLELKNLTDEFIWNAVWQQSPIAAKGLLFPASSLNWFKLDELQKDKNNRIICDAVVSFCDTADEGADYLANPIGIVIKDKVYVVDVIYTQEQVEITEPLVAQLLVNWNVNKAVFESNNGGKGFARNVEKIIKENYSARPSIKWRRENVNKETRILLKSGQVKKHFYFRSDFKSNSQYAKFMDHFCSYLKLGKNQQDGANDSITGLCEITIEQRGVTASQRLY